MNDHEKDRTNSSPEESRREYEPPRAEDVSEDESIATASLVAS